MSQQPPDLYHKDPTRDLTDEEVQARATQLFQEPELDKLAKQLIQAGWDVYWRKPPFGKSSYFQVHKDKHFAYVELGPWGFNLATKHIPHASIGTGFTVKRQVESLSVGDIAYAAALICPPEFESYRNQVTKYPDLRNYLRHNNWSPLHYVVIQDDRLVVGKAVEA